MHPRETTHRRPALTAMVGVLCAIAASSNAALPDPAPLAAASTSPPLAERSIRPMAVEDSDGLTPAATPESPPRGQEADRAAGAEPAPPATAGAKGIPVNVLEAYRKAEQALAGSCNLRWYHLAGIGKIESGHARGGRADPSGETAPRILGPVLDGGEFAAIRDTDGGRHDGDRTWDRAVGPMQFIPSTWQRYAADGNGDGASSPHNIHDSAVAAGKYLCSGGMDLSKQSDLDAAVFRYNHSRTYVVAVETWMRAYSDGAVEVPALPPGADGDEGGSDGGKPEGAGASGESSSAAPESSVPESSAPESAAAESAAADPSAPDSSAADSSAPDSAAPDSSAPGSAESPSADPAAPGSPAPDQQAPATPDANPQGQAVQGGQATNSAPQQAGAPPVETKRPAAPEPPQADRCLVLVQEHAQASRPVAPTADEVRQAGCTAEQVAAIERLFELSTPVDSPVEKSARG
ncbi:lytic murein transglycosylase [Actinosynnema sp.]|uniref:lytic transglycosylase domain-containing protein n=1 Tax=Actinosynnema sp. TaxID=1872144 RepID=UPI003F853DBE